MKFFKRYREKSLGLVAQKLLAKAISNLVPNPAAGEAAVLQQSGLAAKRSQNGQRVGSRPTAKKNFVSFFRKRNVRTGIKFCYQPLAKATHQHVRHPTVAIADDPKSQVPPRKNFLRKQLNNSTRRSIKILARKRGTYRHLLGNHFRDSDSKPIRHPTVAIADDPKSKVPPRSWQLPKQLPN